MTVFVIRHAYAGERASWTRRPDRERPLDDVGWEQAEEVARVVAERPVARLISSPARRCLQTLEPLASKVGLAIGMDDRLAEGAAPLSVLGLLAEVPEFSVLCVHGAELATMLGGVGVTGDRCLSKAVIWSFERDRSGGVVGASWRRCAVLEPVTI